MINPISNIYEMVNYEFYLIILYTKKYWVLPSFRMPLIHDFQMIANGGKFFSANMSTGPATKRFVYS